MHPLSLGPHRGADWLGRSAIGGREAGTNWERYVVRLWDPHAAHDRAVWLCMSLGHDGEASCHVETFSPVSAENRSAREAWPLERTTLDPERAGIGIGECQVQPESTQGLVRGGDFSVAWRCQFSDGVGPIALYKRESLYRPRRLSHKAAMLTVGAIVHTGELEIWHDTGRAARVTRIPLTGWHASVHHLWGKSAFSRYALWDQFSKDKDAPSIAATTYETTWFGLKRLQPQQGVAVQAGDKAVFNDRACLWGAHEGPAEIDGRWPVTLRHGHTRITGHVCVPAGQKRQVSIGQERLFVSSQATFEGTVQMPGATPTAPMRLQRGLLEWSA